MRKRFAFLTLGAGLLATACASVPAPTPAPPALPPGAIQAPIRGADGRDVGLVSLAQGPEGVLIRLNILPNVLPPGWHGVHLHEVSDCNVAGFTAAGPHVGHGGRVKHGLLAADGPEPGDLPNLYVPEKSPQGPAVEMFSSMVSLGPARGRVNLRDSDGSSLMIHESADDHVTQPIGGAGARIACAMIPPAGP